MDIIIGTAQKLTSPNPFALLATRKPGDKTNLMAVSWWTYASNHPPMVAVCLSKKGYSGELIQIEKEFSLNVVDESLKEAAFKCGTCSGREVDKPEQFGIALKEAKVINTKLVAASRVSLECRLVNSMEAADHMMYLAEVVSLSCDENMKAVYAWDGYKRLDSI